MCDGRIGTKKSRRRLNKEIVFATTDTDGSRVQFMIHVAVVGAYGSAGVAVAQRLAEHDAVRLTLIDDGDPGGLCILRGCMPSKAVLSAGAHRHQARVDDRLVGTPSVDRERTIERKNAQISEFAAHRQAAVQALTDASDITFLQDSARFVDNRTLAVGDQRLTPDYIVIATGSTPSLPDLTGIETVDPTTSSELLERTTFPDSAVIMGFGAVGVEMAPYLSEVGDVDVTVIEHDERPLDYADPVYGDELLDLYEQSFNIDIHTQTIERAVEPTDDDGVRLEVTGPDGRYTITADELFAFTGRRPALDRLGLETTDMTPSSDWVQPTLQTRSNPQVFVAGDANGQRPILHVAKEEGHLAADNILAHARGDPLTEYTTTPHRVTFAGLGVYPYARIGMTAEEAAALDRETIVVSRAAADDGVFRVKDAPHGRATLVVDATDGTVLGYQGLHYHADVMVKTMQVAVETGLDVRELPDRAYHPTTPELLDGLFRAATTRLSA